MVIGGKKNPPELGQEPSSGLVGFAPQHSVLGARQGIDDA